MSEFLQTQEILRKCFVNVTNTLRGTSQYSTQDYFNAVFVPSQDALNISGLGGGSSIYWLEPVANVASLLATATNGAVCMVMDNGSGTSALYFYHGGWAAIAGGSSGITVQDEGTTLVAGATTLNFIGATVKAESAGNGVVNIYIPPVVLSSHFNTTDGGTTATVSPVSTTQRYVSSPSSEGSPFKIGSWNGTTALYPCINTSSISYTTVNACSFSGTTSTLTAQLIDANGTTVLATNTASNIGGNISVLVQGINLQVTGWTAETSSMNKGVIAVNFNIAALLSNGGRFSIRIVQTSGGVNYTFTQNDIFFDANTVAQSIGSVSIAETSGHVTLNKKSGVQAYTTGSQFTVNVANMNNMNNDSFPAPFMQVSGSNYGLTQQTVTYASTGLSNWTNKWNNTGASWSITNWAITQTNYFTRQSCVASAMPVDWSNGSWVNSGSSSSIVDTYTDNSTRVYEDFTSETYRLKSDLSTAWDGTQSLMTFDSGTGLQVGDGTYLEYPTINYSIYNPNPAAQFNYTAATGSRVYYRRMYHTNTNHSNGNFNILGVTEAQLTSGAVKLEISLDGTNWFNCGLPYISSPLTNGSGCRINSDTVAMPNLAFTFGTGVFTTASTGGGWGVYVRITLPQGSTAKIDLIQITNWS